MTEEQKIHKIAEKRVKEWIEYAKKEYGWENAQYDLFEEPMFELCVQVATLATKELEAQIEKMKCCGNCLHQYEGQYHNGFRCKDHYKEEVCESYEWELAK